LGGGLLAVVTPWAAALINGHHWAFIQGFLGFSHLQRATQAVDGHDQPLLFYLPVLLGLIWPWWPLLLSAVRQLCQRRRHWQQTEERIERLQQLAAVWLLLGLVLFSAIPTKLPGYVLPLLPAAVLLIATAPRHPSWCLRLVSLQLGLLSVALLAGLISMRLGKLGSYGQALLSAPGGGNCLACRRQRPGPARCALRRLEPSVQPGHRPALAGAATDTGAGPGGPPPTRQS
jgi:4-amino-4-deoxy-L-arabinose transferase-like glycosyltransferase